MKVCPKLCLCSTILAKILSYYFLIICHSSYWFLPFLGDLTLGINVPRVKSSHLAKMPC
jgi:hypothetical protein